jgi:hypothetical protein
MLTRFRNRLLPGMASSFYNLFTNRVRRLPPPRHYFLIETNMRYVYQLGRWIIDLFRALLQVDPIYPIQH